MHNLNLTIAVLDAVGAERERQTKLFADGLIPFDCADPSICSFFKLPVLIEEVGEVAQEMNDPEHDAIDLYTELVQVAAVAVAMAEAVMLRHSPDGVAAETRNSQPFTE